MNQPFVRVVQGLPDEPKINDALTEATKTGATLVSMTVFGEGGAAGGVILLFESKVESRKRVPNDTSVIGL